MKCYRTHYINECTIIISSDNNTSLRWDEMRHGSLQVGVLFSKNNSDFKTFMNGFCCHSTVNVIVHTNN